MASRLPLIFILITMVIDAMGIGLILPVMPDLLQEVQGGTLGTAAVWGGILTTSFAVMQFVFGPVMGNLSDRFGRRPILLISLVVMAADYVVMAVASTIWLLLAARLVAGITAATQPIATAYIADISTPEKKSARFGLLSAAFGVGFILGPMIGGWLGEFGPRTPFLAAAALAGLNALFGLFVLPETLGKDKQRPFQWSRANPIGALRQMRRLPGLNPLFVAFFLFEFAFYVYPVIWAYFTQARFGWSTATIGTTLAIYGISIAVTQTVLIRLFLKKLGERNTMFAGLGFSLVSFVALGFISNGTLLMLMIPMSALGVITIPAMQGLMSKATPANQQGELQGAATSVRSLAVIISPLIMTRVFAAATKEELSFQLPGAPFLLSAVLIVLCALALRRAP
ncbi:TCR/Tet family MFS transporter [Actibacterium pelagium]|uniref:Tetracycline resistance MFS efflux pump n=1 Tax=Actibacterium pelagium TaxID=2029103 RepID=A0A917AM71_9RHOB|nr:TCR/Tet family MFS transporter [Actibacterium pelagium]GGE60933.1 tetracycline resistance MFS efflux pump [Actibacterium pelagium]